MAQDRLNYTYFRCTATKLTQYSIDLEKDSVGVCFSK